MLCHLISKQFRELTRPHVYVVTFPSAHRVWRCRFRNEHRRLPPFGKGYGYVPITRLALDNSRANNPRFVPKTKFPNQFWHIVRHNTTLQPTVGCDLF